MEKSKEYSLSNVSKGYLPQFSVNAQATYQSDVTSLGIKLPGFEIDKISKDQYRVYGELNQILYDGGIIKNKKESIKTEKEADVAFMEVKLYQLKNQIEELFFGILVLNKKLDQNIIYQKDL
ncbi:TolC family protein [Chryseobacterium sp. POL2]|uniref:TolC family protein n=1 Tax=Chryseobacterium sp. POL2 TaxID=2713414 RepID=UPI0013E19E87|nr:TolC family protein [Chryseobacterium sp. POL2]QIG88904.1 TolC family protein [Chryseobacterium sp. POL2]